MDNEVWLPVPGYELYEVSDRGRVRSIDRVALSRWGTPKQVRGKVLRQSSQGRYLVVTLYRDGKAKTFSVHRLVLLAFVGPCPAGQEALHFDDNPVNNALSNLRWGTPGDNARDCIRNGNHPKVEVTHCPRGHEYSSANTYITPSTGHRICRACIGERAESNKTQPHCRDRTHCPQGHPYDESNTKISNGRRHCLTCGRERAREYQRRRRAAQHS